MTSKTRSGAVLRSVTGYLTVVGGSAGGRLLSFVVGVIVARALTPSEFGDFTVFFALMVIFATTGDFIDITYLRRAHDPRLGGASQQLRAAMLLRCGLFALLLVLAYPLGLLLAHTLLGRPELSFEVTAAVLCGAGIGFVTLRASAFLAAKRLVLYGVTSSLFYLVVLAILLPTLAVTGNLEPEPLYVLFVGTSAVVGAVSAVSVARGARPLQYERDAVAASLRFAKWLFAANVVQTVYQRLDVVLITGYVSQAAVGQYGAALRYAMIATMLISGLMAFLLPKLGASTSSRTALKSYLREALLLTGFLATAIAVLWASAPTIVPWLFGAEYAPASSIARILLLGTLFTALSLPAGQLLLAEDVPKQILHLGLLRLATMLLLIVLLVPRIGAEGAAWATVVTEALALVYATTVVLRRWPARYRALAPHADPLEASSREG